MNPVVKPIQPKNVQAILWQVSIALMAVLTFTWISIWDTYSLEVLPLQAKYNLGFAKEADYKALSRICFERKRYECASSTSQTLALRFQTKDPVFYQHWMESAAKLNQPKSALAALESLQKMQGPSATLLEQKAKLQLKLGEEQKALESLNKASGLAQGLNRIAIAREHISLLIKMNLFAQAHSKIMEIRHSNALAHLFMEKELRSIQHRIAKFNRR